MVPPRTAEQERADLVVVDPKMKELEPIALFAPAIDLDDLSKIKDELLAAMGEDLDGARPEGSGEKGVESAPASAPAAPAAVGEAATEGVESSFVGSSEAAAAEAPESAGAAESAGEAGA